MTTLIKDTVSNILEIVSDLRGESTTNTDVNRVRAVSRAERDLAKRKYWSFFRIDTTTTADGSSSYVVGSTSYPMRPKGISDIFVGGTTEDKRYQLVDPNQFRFLFNQDNSSRIAYEWYDITTDEFKVFINPTPASGTIYITYYWQPPKRTSDTDAVVSPNMDILARLALAYIYEGEDEEKYTEQLQLAEQMIEEYLGDDDAPNKNMTVTFGQPTNQSIKRLGSY